MIGIFEKAPIWAPKRRRKGPPTTLSRTATRRSNVIRRLFDNLAHDLIEQQLWGVGFDLKYLTARAGDLRFASWLGHDQKDEMRMTELSARLTHSIPILGDVPIRTILKIRRSDRESFLIYRDTVTKILKECLSSTEKVRDRDIDQIYNDVLGPQLVRLERFAKNHRRANVRAALAKLAVPAATMSVGFFGGLVPSQLQDLFVALGGFRVLNNLTEVMTSLGERPDEIRNHNLYFLLRLAHDT